MQLFSRSHTIVAAAGARVIKAGPELPDKASISNPPHTLLEMEDEEAQSLISRGIAERYVRAIHGESAPFSRLEPIDQKPSAVSRLS